MRGFPERRRALPAANLLGYRPHKSPANPPHQPPLTRAIPPAAATPMPIAEHARFVSTFLRHPGQVGAFAPSSRRLAEVMTDWFQWDQAQAVVEYGPGTGVFTEVVAERLSADATFFAIERSSELARLVRRRCPDVAVVEDSVENVVQLCHDRDVSQVDAIVCGLPWASFSDALQRRCLDATMEVLRPGGQFATFAYWQGLALPAGQRFRKRLGQYFRHVERSPTIWQNLPPAFVYRCRR